MRGLIFDFDGLMVDSETVLARHLIALLAERGIEIGFGEVASLFGSSGAPAQKEWERWIGGHIADPGAVRALQTELSARSEAEVASLELREGVVDLIDAADAAGWRVGLGTGRSRRSLEASLRRMGVLDRFDAIVTSAEVERPKPAPDVFLEVARRLRVPPADCVVLEDSAPGCAAALAAGMTVIACPCEVTSVSEFPEGVRKVGALTEVPLADL